MNDIKKLEQEISNIKADISKRKKYNSDEAAGYLRNAESILRDIDKKPHEKFLPNRFDIFVNSLQDGRKLFRAEMFEAAIAIALSARSGLERLGYDIDDKVQEWNKNFDIFTLKLDSLREKINHEISERKTLTNKNIRAEIISDIDYWSRGEFIGIVELAKKYRESIKECSQIGKEEYIKRLDTPSTDDIKKFINEIDGADKKLSNLSPIYKSRYTASCERSEMGEKIIDFMVSEINLKWLEYLTGFNNHDFREWLKISFSNSSDDKIYVYIIPVESEKVTLNHIVLYIDYKNFENETYSQDILNHVCEALNISNDSVDFVRSTEELKSNSNKSYRETGKDIEKMKIVKER